MIVIEICSKKGELSAGKLLSEDFNRLLAMTRNSRETVIKRLQKKAILKREVGKKDSNGKILLSAPKHAYENALQYFANKQRWHKNQLMFSLLTLKKMIKEKA